jgi:microsomal dipeptidase-like Zn-dependent dipeptidase
MADVIGVEHVCIGTDTKLTQPSNRPWGPPPGGPPPGASGPGAPGSGGPAGPRPDGPGQQHPRIGERTDRAWADQTAGFYYSIVDAMLKTGFTPDEIGMIGGGNFLRVFGLAVAKA